MAKHTTALNIIFAIFFSWLIIYPFEKNPLFKHFFLKAQRCEWHELLLKTDCKNSTPSIRGDLYNRSFNKAEQMKEKAHTKKYAEKANDDDDDDDDRNDAVVINVGKN